MEAEAAEKAESHTAALEASDTAVAALQYMQSQVAEEQNAVLGELASWVRLALAAAAAPTRGGPRPQAVASSAKVAKTPGRGSDGRRGLVVSESNGGTKLLLTDTDGISAIDLRNLHVSTTALSSGADSSRHSSDDGKAASPTGSATSWAADGPYSSDAADLVAASPALAAAAAIDAAGRAMMGDDTWMLSDELSRSGFSSMALSMHTAGGDASQLGGRLAAATSVAAAAATTAADSGKGLHLEAVPRSAGRTGVGAAPTGEVAEDSRQLVSSQQLLARLYQQAEAMGLDREIIDDALEAFEGSHARVRGCC